MSDSDPPPVFSAVLTPHRSLRPEGARLVVILVAIASCVAATPFVVMGFWPVAGFYGLDVLLLAWAMRACLDQARGYEELVLSPIELTLRKVPARGPVREWRFNPLWTRLHREEHAEFGVQRLSLFSRGEHVPVGQFLGPDEKADLGEALSRALATARRGG